MCLVNIVPNIHITHTLCTCVFCVTWAVCNVSMGVYVRRAMSMGVYVRSAMSMRVYVRSAMSMRVYVRSAMIMHVHVRSAIHVDKSVCLHSTVWILWTSVPSIYAYGKCMCCRHGYVSVNLRSVTMCASLMSVALVPTSLDVYMCWTIHTLTAYTDMHLCMQSGFEFRSQWSIMIIAGVSTSYWVCTCDALEECAGAMHLYVQSVLQFTAQWLRDKPISVHAITEM